LCRVSGTWKHAKSEGHEDYGLLVSQPAKKYGIAVDLPEKVDPKDGAVVLQYDLRLQSGLECGGAYLKFLQPQVRVGKGCTVAMRGDGFTENVCGHLGGWPIEVE
jgi:hypothetical protein